MKKFVSILSAAILAASAVLPVSAVGESAQWKAGNGFQIDGANSPVTITETDDGIQASWGGYYAAGDNWGGIASKDVYDLDGFSIEFRVDKIPNTGTDTWMSFSFLQNADSFYTGGDFSKNLGIQNLVRYRGNNNDDPYLDNRGPNGWDTIATDNNAAFGIKEGDTVTVSLAKKGDKYRITINGVESSAEYDMSKVAPDGKAHFVLMASMKDSPKDGFQFTITKINGQPAVAKPVAEPTTSAATSDASIAVAALCLVAAAGAIVVTKKLRRA
ncbi:MAG: hypothetical protein HFE63_05650 [Clostridiales bacterium]|nr:hypothetical protein [Clostridiales bacterium]